MFAQLLAANQEQYDLHSSLKYQPKPHLSEAASSVKDIKFADSIYKKNLFMLSLCMIWATASFINIWPFNFEIKYRKTGQYL